MGAEGVLVRNRVFGVLLVAAYGWLAGRPGGVVLRAGCCGELGARVWARHSRQAQLNSSLGRQRRGIVTLRGLYEAPPGVECGRSQRVTAKLLECHGRAKANIRVQLSARRRPGRRLRAGGWHAQAPQATPPPRRAGGRAGHGRTGEARHSNLQHTKELEAPAAAAATAANTRYIVVVLTLREANHEAQGIMRTSATSGKVGNLFIALRIF